jgi:secondary thiamine-phosphate synthase enzyme
MSELEVRSHNKSELIDITDQVRRMVAESGIQEGMCYLFVPHTTAGIILNENWDATVKDDILSALEDITPPGPYSHREGNAPAHILTALVGSQVTLFVEGGQPLLGTWQGVFLAEFDGPRSRRVLLRVTGIQKAGGQTP